MAIAENDLIDLVAGLLAAVGALNWGTAEFLDYDILQDLLAVSPGTQEYQVVVGAIGLAGAFVLYSNIWWNTEVLG